jgi:hypothetical protein
MNGVKQFNEKRSITFLEKKKDPYVISSFSLKLSTQNLPTSGILDFQINADN